MTQDKGWAARVAAEIGRSVAHYRDRAGISAQQLADRCAELGMQGLSRVVLTRLENGRREAVSTGELQVLARALNVPPGLLIYPVGSGQKVEVLPGQFADPWDALRWFGGEIEDPMDPLSHPSGGSIGFSLFRFRAYSEVVATLRYLAASDDESAHARIPGQAAAIRAYRAEMRSEGFTPPDLPPDIAAIVENGTARRAS